MFYIWAEGPKSVCWRTLDFALAAWQPSARPLPRGRLPRGPAGGLRPRPYFFSGQVAGQCCASQIWVAAGQCPLSKVVFIDQARSSICLFERDG
jgi:hypothetical protein